MLKTCQFRNRPFRLRLGRRRGFDSTELSLVVMVDAVDMFRAELPCCFTWIFVIVEELLRPEDFILVFGETVYEPDSLDFTMTTALFLGAAGINKQK
jgi:hypothetical protein